MDLVHFVALNLKLHLQQLGPLNL